MEKNIREILNSEVFDVLREFISNESNKKDLSFYTGKVVDNNDPEKIGRCRIRVYGVFDDIPLVDIPWALPDFSFIGSKVGSFIVPPIDTIVKVYFDNDDIHLPRYTSKIVDKNNLPTDKNVDYPNTMVFFESDDGDKFLINRQTKKLEFHHSSGNVITMDLNGNTTININGDETHSVVGDHVIENENLKTSFIKISKNGEITIDGGTSNLTVNGNNVTIDHRALLTVTGTAVIPSTTGPLNCLPVDTLTGMPHAGNIVSP